MEKRSLITIFARCFRLLAKTSAAVDDGFFAELLNQASERLLHDYINFLKHEGMRGVASHVAQCRLVLIFEIKSILKLISILKHLEFIKSTTPLLLERDLLLLELAIRKDHREKQISGKAGRADLKPERIQTKHQTPSISSLSPVHKQIAQFVSGHERVQNLEVFSKFSNVARRTLKRKLSELIKAGAIKRVTEGKKVFYTFAKISQ